MSTQISPCPELSITDFQKINGYPQNDGSYIDQVQYTTVFTPSDNMLSYVADYANKQKVIENEGAADAAKIQAAKDQITAMACLSTYQSVVQGLSETLNTIPMLGDSDSLGDNSATINPSGDTQLIDNDVIFITGYLKSRQNWPFTDESSNQWPQQHIRDDYGNMASLTQEQAIEVDQKAISEYQSDLNILRDLKGKLEKSVSQLSTCQGDEQDIVQNNQSASDHLQALNVEMASAQSEDRNALENEMNKDCPIIIATGVLGMFGANYDDIEAYGKTHTVTVTENVHLVKSDNGWVIQ